MKVWQEHGWERRIGELQGSSLRVLWHLVTVAKWGNTVPGPTEVALSLHMRRPNVSHAYGELVKVDLLQKVDMGYRLNPMFCWKGTDEQYEQACRMMLEQVGATSNSPAIMAHTLWTVT